MGPRAGLDAVVGRENPIITPVDHSHPSHGLVYILTYPNLLTYILIIEV